MQSNQESKCIPSKLERLLTGEVIKKEDLQSLIGATRRFVEGLLEDDYAYDITSDPTLEKLEILIDCYHQQIKRHRAPDNIGLLNTKTYRNKNDPRNPHMREKSKAFGLGKNKEERTTEEKDRYFEWLRSMVLIDRESAKNNPEKVEEKANQYIARAIRHISTTFFNGQMKEELPSGFSQSPFYNIIHRENITVLELLELAENYLSEYVQIAKIRRGTEKDIRSKNDRSKAMYEIARIFAFASIYVDIEHVPGQENYLGDKLFLVSKLLELTPTGANVNMKKILSSDNPFFDYTTTRPIHWRKTREGGYEYVPSPISHGPKKTHTIKFESLDFTGPVDTFGSLETIPVLHIDFRNEKTPESAANKVIRKGLASPKEILDTRGFRFVVRNEKEAMSLINLLAHSLSSVPETAWSEKPKWEKNNESGASFQCLKGTLKIFHKRNDTKKALEHIRESITDPVTQERLSYLFSDKGHILETEIQIFIGEDSYISAHHDKSSTAYAENYKLCQHILEASLIFPPAIFPETHDMLVARLSEKETGLTMEKIRKKIGIHSDKTL